MTNFQMPGHTTSVDFDMFHFESHGWNYDVAKELATILMAYLDLDDLRGFNDKDSVYYASTVGTGGDWNMQCNSVGVQRALLAANFASYAQKQYKSCWISIHEYNCIAEVLKYLRDDYYPADHRKQIVDSNIAIMEEFCSEFRKAYAQVEPSFLFEVLKE